MSKFWEGASFSLVRPLASCDHGSDEVFSVDKAGQHYAKDMKYHQRKRYVCECLVHFLKGVFVLVVLCFGMFSDHIYRSGLLRLSNERR
jgi:hypothetical protein